MRFRRKLTFYLNVFVLRFANNQKFIKTEDVFNSPPNKAGRPNHANISRQSSITRKIKHPYEY